MTSKRTRPITGLAAASLLLLLLAAGCGDNGTAAAPTTAAVATTTTPATTAPPTTAVDAAKVTGEVTAAYTTFFENFKGDPALLEDGAQLAAGLDSLRARASTMTIAVAVKGVKALEAAGCDLAGVPAPCAEVTYDLVVNGTPAVPDQTGYAVQQGGAWKVAKTTFCSLAAMGGGTPAGC